MMIPTRLSAPRLPYLAMQYFFPSTYTLWVIDHVQAGMIDGVQSHINERRKTLT